ncbi:MAG: hypothetical protein HYY84_06105 [Deltaproteobacteria bacterium]|nr:hypothetical protein [Deltaproteobacteria bacterium]
MASAIIDFVALERPGHSSELANATLIEQLRERARAFDRDRMAPYVAHFRAKHSDTIAGIFFYGSRLAEGERAKGSLCDFFIVYDDARFHERVGQRLLNCVLAPNVYTELFDGCATKVSTVSLARFRREMSPAARDIYHQGRFGKRVALVYARDGAAEEVLLATWLAGMRALVGRTLDLLGETFTFEEFLLEVLTISYRGEVRAESPDKVARLLEAERPFYEVVYRRLLEERTGTAPYRQAVSRWRRFWTRRFLARSRRRMFYRWPKMILTVRNWLEVALAKLERTKGIVLPLTPLQRRFPLIFGWGHLWRVWRRGLLKGPDTHNANRKIETPNDRPRG